MNRRLLNQRIRNDIAQYIELYGKFNTRQLITSLSLKYSTSKQRISGNISFVAKLNIYQINTIIPNKKSYIY